MKVVTELMVRDRALALARGLDNRESVALWARELIDQSDKNMVSVDDSVWDLVTYLVLVDERVPGGRYLFCDDDIKDELGKFEVRA